MIALASAVLKKITLAEELKINSYQNDGKSTEKKKNISWFKAYRIMNGIFSNRLIIYLISTQRSVLFTY